MNNISSYRLTAFYTDLYEDFPDLVKTIEILEDKFIAGEIDRKELAARITSLHRKNKHKLRNYRDE